MPRMEAGAIKKARTQIALCRTFGSPQEQRTTGRRILVPLLLDRQADAISVPGPLLVWAVVQRTEANMATKQSNSGGYRYRDSGNGQYLKEREALRRDPRTVERE